MGNEVVYWEGSDEAWREIERLGIGLGGWEVMRYGGEVEKRGTWRNFLKMVLVFLRRMILLGWGRGFLKVLLN